MKNRLETLESILKRLRHSIKQNGLKSSKQREEIISVLYKSGRHLSPEEITAELRTRNKSTSISSVYRILGFLEKENFITALEPGKSGKRYEIAAKEHHDHIICLNCGTILEFVDEEIESRQIQVANAYKARLVSHDMRLFVICEKCQKEKS
ncbi:Fur family transcriptional regulator [Helicobacter fennelliae]|uniref:Ferric uptake regulation protein n=2 Tax=Helicobacter fennelliae TaxID=215 RepID=T1DWU3_9HELI|nr:Fur family transcriptional regulator [Helicobacter fennelliae]GAD19928.1 ferric uptake regulation protein FUR [Helicobacter fennelliae MRY12-0050]SQB97595.1 ferric uptake regulator [Helicobacter fennelliae]STP06949.1 ferric uptake regulator [Helicobacter fennelliae]STQ83505.1 ferric uptake regulator [Helicobacter fennelliae]